ncbi:PREDICTED: uncharacterized protein LOC104744086 [Camelina sativa]|uniref:Uncharacterized protein LOC104744086 n=1 Tax=Camelina sativa TaxID=90675 RepID=A0ABM1QWM3_CAMSA|nr:PREDICTED: uncharacterized protein LOC104744086 [Camelina sativa]
MAHDNNEKLLVVTGVFSRLVGVRTNPRSGLGGFGHQFRRSLLLQSVRLLASSCLDSSVRKKKRPSSKSLSQNRRYGRFVYPQNKNVLEELAKDKSHSHFPSFILEGLQVLHVGKGIVRCKLTVTHHALNEDGNFHTAAIGVLIELMGAAAVYSVGGSHASVDLNYSFYSTAKIHEEIKIEARLVGKMADLKSAIIEIRRECDEELIATGRLRMRLLMTPFNLNVKQNGVDQVSKL